MPMRIRLSMQGNKNSKFFHIVAIPHTKRRDAKPTELLGIYDPRVKPGVEHRTVHWSVDRIRYWLSVGAVPSDRVVKLLEMGHILAPNSPFRRMSHAERSAVEKLPKSAAENANFQFPTLSAVKEHMETSKHSSPQKSEDAGATKSAESESVSA